MDFKFLEIGTRIAIGQFDATIIEYDVLDGFSGLFPVYVVRFDTGETEPVHHTDITGLVYDNPLPVEVIEARKAYRAEHGDDAPDPLEEIEIEHAEMGDAEDYDQLRIERGEFETENYQLKQQLAAVTAERDKLREAATYAMNFVDRLGADSPVVFGGEADVYHKLRAALGFDSE